MSKFPKLGFPQYPFRVCRGASNGQLRIWDRMRGMWLVLTPEEWVRRHMAEYLASVGVPAVYISQEYPVDISGMAQRADIVVTDQSGRPLLLVECKAPDITLDSRVYAQAVRYNSVVKAPYLVLTNGVDHQFFRMKDTGEYDRCTNIPDLEKYFGQGGGTGFKPY